MLYKLSIVVPFYNEQNRIAQSVRQIAAFFENENEPYELIFVNDGSVDQSVKVLEAVLAELNGQFKKCSVKILHNEGNKGKGYSVRKGILAAQGQYVLFSDADLSTPIEEVGKMLKAVREGYNIAIGSRAVADSDVAVRQNIIRQSMGKFFNLLVRNMAGLDFKDTQCGFKCFDRQAIENIFDQLTIDDFSFDVEILYLAKLKGLKVKEVGVRWENSTESKVGVIKDSWAMLMNLTRLKNIHGK
ncbi:MAG: glycosyltransferase family 2 protein [Candidatus Omnitrophica bacterium]|nr:glycosyltransferase family 2 protein [Candidatus Omnitrophota bacterium]